MWVNVSYPGNCEQSVSRNWGKGEQNVSAISPSVRSPRRPSPPGAVQGPHSRSCDHKHSVREKLWITRSEKSYVSRKNQSWGCVSLRAVDGERGRVLDERGHAVAPAAQRGPAAVAAQLPLERARLVPTRVRKKKSEKSDESDGGKGEKNRTCDVRPGTFAKLAAVTGPFAPFLRSAASSSRV